MFESYHNAIAQLLSLTNLQHRPFGSASKKDLKKSLERTEAFLTALGSPQDKLQFIHVGGTSGKGSVSKYMHEILVAAGKTVGTYTSPHTTTYLERFAINKTLISPVKLTSYIRDVITTYETFLAEGNEPLSFFELSTCLAIYTFEREHVEWCILEVGCGGRFDATNVIPAPAVAIITNIDKDHTELLGNSLSEIAFEKAGIIKKGSTVFCGENRQSLKKIFMDEAIKNNAALFFVGEPKEQFVDFDFGTHQQKNAFLALHSAEEIGIEKDLIKATLKKAIKLPCRFEFISKKPVIILDGAHSPVKCETTADRIKDLFGKAHIIFGSTATKDAKKMLKSLEPVAYSITTTRFSTTFKKASNPFQLKTYVKNAIPSKAFIDAQKALEYVQSIAKKNEPIVITGSLFLAGELREKWISEKDILQRTSSFPFDK